MAWATDSLELRAGKIYLRNIRVEDDPAIAEAVHDPAGWPGTAWGVDTKESILEMLRRQREAHTRLECNPFVYFVDDEVAGITRFLNISPSRRGLEIGGTWVAPRWRRSFVNTEVKRLLLGHCFETIGAVRVEFRVDCHNYASQMNVLRLGNVFEGKIRHWQVRKDGTVPDGLLYSMTHHEWGEAKERFTYLARNESPPPKFLPVEAHTERLRLRLYKLADSPGLLDLAKRNRESLVDSFPQIGKLREENEVRAYIAEKTHGASAGTTFYYGVWDRRGDRPIGQFQLKNLDWRLKSAELGYFLDESARRRGFAQELLHWALAELEERRGFRRLFVRVLLDNSPSLALAKKMGFREEGILRRSFLTGRGKAADTVLLARYGGF